MEESPKDGALLPSLNSPETPLEPNEVAKGVGLAALQRRKDMKKRLSPRLSRGPIAKIHMAGKNAKINSQRQQELSLDRAQLSELAGLCGLQELEELHPPRLSLAPAMVTRYQLEACYDWLKGLRPVPLASNCQAKSSTSPCYPSFTYCLAAGRVHLASSPLFS